MDSLKRIHSLLAQQRKLRALTAALHFAFYLIGFQALLLAVLGWFSIRYPLNAAFIRAMAWTYALYALLPAAYWRHKIARKNSTEAVARELDHANASAPDPFQTSLSLANHGPETLGQLDRLFAGFLPKVVLPRPPLLPFAQRIALGIGAVALLASAIATGHPQEFLRRASSPWEALQRLPILRFDLREPHLVLAVGDTAKVEGRLKHLIPGQTVFAYVRSTAGEKRFPLEIQGDSFAFAYGPVEGDFSLRFAADNGRSNTLKFRALPPPFLARIQAVIAPPGYTRLKPDTLPSGVAHFPVLPGTRVTWMLDSDRPLKRMGWTFVTDTLRNKEDTLGPGKSFQVVREIRRPTDYAYWLEDEEGIRSQPSLAYRVDLLPDDPPEVDLVSPSSDLPLDRDGKVPLAFRVKDDFGVTSLKLVYRVLADGKVKAEGQRDCKDWLKLAQAGLVETIWDLESLHVQPENSVEFHLVATDNDTVNGPKTGKSVVRTLRMPSLQEVLATSHQREQSAVANIKSALQREKQIERKLERENQAPREEGPPMLADYEVNRIMVEDPHDHLRRAEAVLGQIQLSLSRKQKDGESGNDKSGAKNEQRENEAARAAETNKAMSAVKEMQEYLKKSEPAMPQGNQAFLPMDEKKKNLENLIKSQKEQAEKMAALEEKLAKLPNEAGVPDPPKNKVDNLAKELAKNVQSQNDLRKWLEDQATQAKAKSDLVDQALAEQMRMTDDMKSAMDDIKKTMDQGQKNGIVSPDLLDKMKKIQDLLKEVLPDSLKKMLEKRVSGQEVDPQELRDKLKQMLEKQAELAENLNRALAMLEQLRDRKHMEELKQALTDLQKRETALEKKLRAGEAGAAQEEEQKAIQQETQKALADFAAQSSASKNSAAKKEMQELNKKLQPAPVQKDMQDVRDNLAKNKSGKSGASAKAASAAASSAKSASDKLGAMSDALTEEMDSMDNSVDISEAQELLQESLSLSRLQILIREGSAKRQAEGWEADEASLYGSVAQTAQWLNERVKTFAAKIPFFGQAMTAEARNMSMAAQEAARQYTWDVSEKSLRHNQNLSRELLKLIKMANAGGQGAGSGMASGKSGGKGQGQGGGGSGGDVSGELKGMSGKQMAINSATYELLQAMLEGRQPARGQSGGMPGMMPGGKQPGGQGKGGKGGKPGSQGDGEDGSGGEGGQPGGDGTSTLQGLGNKQGELGENLESMAEGMDEQGGAAQKLRGLAEEARALEEDLRQGRLSPEEIRRRQERFQTRLLESANAMQERGQSEKREGETSHGSLAEVPDAGKIPDEAKLIQLLREARKNAKALRLTEAQRKYLDEYYESLLTR